MTRAAMNAACKKLMDAKAQVKRLQAKTTAAEAQKEAGPCGSGQACMALETSVTVEVQRTEQQRERPVPASAPILSLRRYSFRCIHFR
jgi:multidrug resistance efflux pump